MPILDNVIAVEAPGHGPGADSPNRPSLCIALLNIGSTYQSDDIALPSAVAARSSALSFKRAGHFSYNLNKWHA